MTSYILTNNNTSTYDVIFSTLNLDLKTDEHIAYLTTKFFISNWVSSLDGFKRLKWVQKTNFELEKMLFLVETLTDLNSAKNLLYYKYYWLIVVVGCECKQGPMTWMTCLAFRPTPSFDEFFRIKVMRARSDNFCDPFAQKIF